MQNSAPDRLFDGCDRVPINDGDITPSPPRPAQYIYYPCSMSIPMPHSRIAMAPAGPGSHSPSPPVSSPIHTRTPSDVPTIVHNLIRDMKALEAALHRWSLAQATPEDVSDRYVQFGVEFNAVVHAFEGYDIPTRYAPPWNPTPPPLPAIHR